MSDVQGSRVPASGTSSSLTSGCTGRAWLLVASAVVAAVVVVAATTVIIIATAVVVTAAVIAASAAFASVIGGLTTCLLDIYLLLAGDAAAFLTVAFGITAPGQAGRFCRDVRLCRASGACVRSSPKGR